MKVKVSYKWNLVQIKHPLTWLKKVHLKEQVLDTFILVLMESSKKVMVKPFLSVKISFYLCLYFWDGSSEMHFLRKQFWSALMFENSFFEEAILKCTHVLKRIFWGSNYFNFLIPGCCRGCCFILSWLLSVNKYSAKCGTSLRL